MHITELAQIEPIRAIIGQQNAVAIQEAFLADWYEAWFFGSREEFEREKSSLLRWMQEKCLQQFESGETWAMVISAGDCYEH